MAAPRQYPLLDPTVDKDYRAHLMANEGKVLKPLRPCTHKPLMWDERYAPYLRRAGFHDLARAIMAGLPEMAGALLTSFVDHWRPETHTFHLHCGEMAPLMQDVGYILGLRLNGVVVSGSIDIENLKELVHQLTGHYPLDPEEGKKEKKTSGVLTQK